jgi:hypothetical protein
VGICVVEDDEAGAVAHVCQVPILPRVDDEGKRSGVTLVGVVNVRLGKEKRRRCTMRARTLTTMATGEGEMEGEVDM